jgi:Rps23 Pro-64 3,4-dihydroxylase Tpa1-like proline 4-hydroxylase
MSLLDFSAFEKAPLQHDPCDFIVVPGFVSGEALAAVNRDYPDIDEPGNFDPEGLTYGPAFAQLLGELDSPELRQLYGAKFGFDLSDFPLQLTVRKYSEISDGNIHNDSQTKILTTLIYFNEEWPHDTGKIRLLRGSNNIDDYAAEVEPMGGTLLAFRRSERSFHGFKPVEAERRSIQMYWVKAKREGRDGKNRNSLKRRLKRLIRGRD